MQHACLVKHAYSTVNMHATCMFGEICMVQKIHVLPDMSITCIYHECHMHVATYMHAVYVHTTCMLHA